MKTSMKTTRILFGILTITVGLFTCTAATFTVTTTNNSGPGSLPAAITAANTTPGKNQIDISVTNTITLGSQLPAITNSVAITGLAAAPAAISGGGTLPLFTFGAGTTNSLSNLALADGYTTNSGAAISNSGTLSVSNCQIVANIATNGHGGAIINNGVMAISSSEIAGNQAGAGGAVYNAATMMLSNSQMIANRAGNGGAVFNAGSLAVCELIMEGNFAMSGIGGGFYNTGALAISGTTFAGNNAFGAAGQPGGMGAGGAESGGGGGGGGGGGIGGALFAGSGTIGITNSTFVGNVALGGNGGQGGATGGVGGRTGGNGGAGGGNGGGAGGVGGLPYNPGASGAGGQFGGGGGGGGGAGDVPGLHPDSGGAGGLAGFGGGTGGGGGGSGTSGYGGGGGSGFGGAILIQTGSLFLVNCTIVDNGAIGGPGGTNGTQGQGCGGGVYSYGGSVMLVNTIVAGNIASISSPDLMGSFLSSGYNLIENNQGATGLSIFDFQDVPADLGPLQSNGGPTPTCAPLQGSFAIDNGTSADAPNTDQRGVPRPQGGGYDIGAVEAVTPSPLFIGPAISPGSGFSLNTIFDATNSYRVQASTDLTNWTDLTNYGSGGAQTFIDMGATNLSQRFYRTVTP